MDFNLDPLNYFAKYSRRAICFACLAVASLITESYIGLNAYDQLQEALASQRMDGKEMYRAMIRDTYEIEKERRKTKRETHKPLESKVQSPISSQQQPSSR